LYLRGIETVKMVEKKIPPPSHPTPSIHLTAMMPGGPGCYFSFALDVRNEPCVLPILRPSAVLGMSSLAIPVVGVPSAWISCLLPGQSLTCLPHRA
jgi:hypothetical protein